MDPLDPSPRTRQGLAAATPTVGAAVEIVGIATSPVIAAWLANDYGLAVVGLYFVLAAGVSVVISLLT